MLKTSTAKKKRGPVCPVVARRHRRVQHEIEVTGVSKSCGEEERAQFLYRGQTPQESAT